MNRVKKPLRAAVGSASLAVCLAACSAGAESGKGKAEGAAATSTVSAERAEEKEPAPKADVPGTAKKVVEAMTAFDGETCSMDRGTACDEDPGEIADLGYPGTYDPRKYTTSLAYKGGVLTVKTSLLSSPTKANKELAGVAGFHYGSAYEWSALMPDERRQHIKKVSEVEIVLSNGRVGIRCEAGDTGHVPQCKTLDGAFK